MLRVKWDRRSGQNRKWVNFRVDVVQSNVGPSRQMSLSCVMCWQAVLYLPLCLLPAFHISTIEWRCLFNLQQLNKRISFRVFNHAHVKKFARCGVRTHAILRLSELKSDALDHSANIAQVIQCRNNVQG